MRIKNRRICKWVNRDNHRYRDRPYTFLFICLSEAGQFRQYGAVALSMFSERRLRFKGREGKK